ncbi:MAG: hypothetical protein JRI54_13340, partial [Deltaproteobacteria bacterium]|nr:hypothetical protein [Deltaproteobacteria bacterium]
MDEKSYKSPLSRTQELIEYSDGRKAVRCYGPHNPHYFMDESGALQPIQIAQLEEAVSAVGDIFLRSKNVVSVGFRNNANPHKYLGLRPDFNQAIGDEQLEFSIEEIKLDGQAQNIDLSKNQVVSPIAVDLGGVVVRSTRQGTRQMVKVSGPIKDFRIAFKLHLKGLKIEHRADLDEYWIYNDQGEFRFRIVQPQIIDASTFRPLEGEYGDLIQDLVKHSLIDNGDGTYTYIKEPGKDFARADLPKDFLIDADTVYSSTADGRVYYTDADWDVAHDAETGEGFSAAETCSGLAHTCFLIGADYRIHRSFYYFDVSGLSGTVSSGSVNVYGYTYAQGNVCAQKGTQGDTLAAIDYDAFTGEYYSVVDWLIDQYNSMTLSAQGKTDLQSVIGSGTFKVCCR